MATLKEIRQRLGWAEDQLVNFIEKAGGTPDADPPTDSALHHVRVARSGLSEHIGSGENAADGDAAVEPVFEDDFEGGLAPAQNGYEWGKSVNAPLGNGAAVPAETTEGAGQNGSEGLRLSHPGKPDGGDSVAQIDLHLGGQPTELWVEYWMKVPENYCHRDSEGSDNNKWFQVYDRRNDPGTGVIVEWQIWDKSDGDTDGLKYLPHETGDIDGFQGRDHKDSYPITQAEQGQWVRWRWHIKRSSSDAASADHDGIVECWKNDELLFSDKDVPIRNSDDRADHFNQIRLLGWSNSGFAEDTHFDFDDVRVWDQDPGW